MKIYLYGAGGHAKVILDILNQCNSPANALIDDFVAQKTSHIHNTPVYAASKNLKNIQSDEVAWIIAIGNNHTRQSISQKLANQGCQFATAIHPSAQIGLGVKIGVGTVIMANAVINTDAQIGQHAIINTGAIIEHDCKIGDYAHVAPSSTLCGQVQIGEGALLGVGTKVKPLIQIGAWSTCGAGSVVVKSLPSKVIAYGNPAQIQQP